MPPRDEDLFQETTMTFGEHLEELRACLFKAIFGLVIGCLVGLAVGGYVVRFIQKPVLDALNEYYITQTVKKVEGWREDLKGRGYVLPESTKALRQDISQNDLEGEKVFVNPREVWAMLAKEKGGPALPPPPTPAPNAGLADQLKPIYIWRLIPDDPRAKMISLKAQEPFGIYLKASLVVGVVLASPWIFYHIWSFVAAGLYPRERRYVHVFLPASLGLFLTGAVMAFVFVFPPVLKFLLGFNSWQGIDPFLRMDEWVGFLLMLPLGFGIAFQLPLVMLFLERIGVVTVKAYLSSWRVAVLSIFIVAMILTPSGDPYSMCLMALPLTVLYFGGVLLCHFLPRREERRD